MRHPVNIKSVIDTEREYDDPRMSANSYDVLLMYVEGIEQLNGVYRLHHSERMDVMLMNGLLKIASTTKLCFGKEVDITEPTSVLEKHVWTTHQARVMFYNELGQQCMLQMHQRHRVSKIYIYLIKISGTMYTHNSKL